MKTQPTIEEFARSIADAMPDVDSTDEQIIGATHRLMVVGDPVEAESISREAGVAVDAVNERLDSWPGVFRDDGRRVIGFWGHSISRLDPEYRLRVDANTTYAWCALDTLFLPALIGQPVRVEASDPVTGEQVSLLVDADGARDVTPAGAMVSMVIPDGPFGYDVIESFCHRVFFFASRTSGDEWSAHHPGTTLLSVDEAFEVGRGLIQRKKA